MRRIKIAEPMIGEEELRSIEEVIRSKHLVHGRIVEEFERRFAEKHACSEGIAVANGTVALETALRSIGVGFGDEVIVPAFTFIATANAAMMLGARPVLCDIDPDILTLDPRCVENNVRRNTRVIIPVHLFGHPADMEPILKIARDSNVYVLEDAAQAHGALYRGRPVGCLGDIGIFSLYATKNITSGEGGIITTNDSRRARFMRLFRDQGQSGKYNHEILGTNYRITSIQGAIALKQLEKLDLFNNIRRRNARMLTERLKKIDWIKTPVEREWAYHVYHQYVIVLKEDPPISRDALREYLLRNGIETAIHYPAPINEQPLYRKLGYSSECCPVSREISRRILSLPIHPALTEDDIDYIASVFEKI
ncbi:MAG: DegT/DnrJ/EryC1/StrS family aminotransferase [Sulfolobales archaeon]